jgi:DNA polymerase elongation subunit (family B)
MTEKLTPEIKVEEYKGDEKPFIPSDVKLEFELKKIEQKYEPIELTIPLYVKPVVYDKKACILNIETTGVSPTNSVVFCIGIMDLRKPGQAPEMFINEDEETLVRNFIDWFEEQDFEEIWGYNINFDYRFLFSRIMRYRLTAPRFMALKQHDIMDLMKKGTEDYVPTLNKPGTLNEWSIFLLGEDAPAEQTKVFEWWEEGNFEEIINYNMFKIEATYDLFLLWLKATGQIEKLPTELEAAGSEEVTGETKLVRCPECLQVQEIPKSATTYICRICGAKNTA